MFKVLFGLILFATTNATPRILSRQSFEDAFDINLKDFEIANVKYKPMSSGDHQQADGKALEGAPSTDGRGTPKSGSDHQQADGKALEGAPSTHGHGTDLGQKYDTECGLAARSRIEYGQESPSADWSWAASVSIECENKSTNAPTILQTCTGVLIGHNHLLTAAHCLYADIKNVMACKGEFHHFLFDEKISYSPMMAPHKYIKVTFGGGNWVRQPKHGIKGYTVHKEYLFNGLNFDVAMIELASPVRFGPRVSRICLPESYTPVDDQAGYVLGYGLTYGAREAQAKVLRETTSLREDLIQFRVSGSCPAQLICSRHQTRQTAPGDSGGPLMREFEGQWYLVGIVKGHRAECQTKSCFTRVTPLCSWLSDVSKGNVRCGRRIQ